MTEKIKILLRKMGRGRLIGLAGLAVLVVGLPVGLALLSKPTNLETPAVVYETSVAFSPTSASLPPDKVFSITVNPGTGSLVFAKAVFNFDKSKYKLETEITTSAQMPTVVRKTSKADANASGTVEITLAVPPGNTPPTGLFTLATFTLGLVSDTSPANSSLTFNSDVMQMVGPNSELYSVRITNASLLVPTTPTTIPPTSTPTPVTITTVPTPTRTPTPSPTRTPTSTPTRTPTPTLVISPAPISTPVVPYCACRRGSVSSNNCGSNYIPVCTSTNTCVCELNTDL